MAASSLTAQAPGNSFEESDQESIWFPGSRSLDAATMVPGIFNLLLGSCPAAGLVRGIGPGFAKL
jgi:hypothetical protein